MLALVLTLFVAVSQQAPPPKPAPPPTLTGKWTMTLEMQMGTASPTLELTQDGEKITGVYGGRYGKFALTGTLKGRALAFSFTMDAEGTPVLMSFQGEVAADFESIKGEADLGGAGEATWYAKREKKDVGSRFPVS